MDFERVYHDALSRALRGEGQREGGEQERQLDCLLHPEKYPPVLRLKDCSCGAGEEHCAAACLFDAIVRDEQGKLTVDPERCSGCGACIEACKSGNLTASRDVLPVLDALKHAKGPAFALIAPAFHGQFSSEVTPGKLRTAFKQLGFTGMVEVALFADILTLKEALEFDRHVNSQADFQLTSCCCPVWISMIRKQYHELMGHVPGAVSPMIAAGRAVKQLHPDALTVFIGPCIAKKAEAREADVAGAVDYVLTFQEIRDIFQAADIRPEKLEETQRDHSSRAGRIYAHTGGVSEAVRATVAQMHPERTIQVNAVQADGVPACRALIETIQKGDHRANFFEGMGCQGGCVGGPKVLVERERGRENVERYGQQAQYKTPLDNPYVPELLRRLGFSSVDAFLEHSDIFVREF
ncbi:MAG: 4Fe-4S binding protein [Oscillospiraceae bacterium]|nr:4Fe-4S binding protein [Oscillospiraceae bacterium]